MFVHKEATDLYYINRVMTKNQFNFFSEVRLSNIIHQTFFLVSLPCFHLCDQEQLPELNVHFRSQSFHTSMYASSWFLTLFLTFLPLPIATRIFDIFMYEVWTQGTLCVYMHVTDLAVYFMNTMFLEVSKI